MPRNSISSVSTSATTTGLGKNKKNTTNGAGAGSNGNGAGPRSNKQNQNDNDVAANKSTKPTRNNYSLDPAIHDPQRANYSLDPTIHDPNCPLISHLVSLGFREAELPWLPPILDSRSPSVSMFLDYGYTANLPTRFVVFPTDSL
jgi:hypothetical protein